MADATISGTSVFTHIINAEAIDDVIARAIREPNTILPLLAYRNIAGKGTKVLAFTGWPADSAAALTETSDMTNTVVGTLTNVQVTVAQCGILREISSLAAKTCIISGDELFRVLVADGAEACRVLAEDAAANLLDEGTAATIGTSGVDASISNFLESIAAMRASNLPGPFVFVGDDQCIADLTQSIASTTGVAWQNQGTQSILNSNSGGYVGQLLGVECYYSNYPDTANGSADVTSGMFVDNRVGTGSEYTAIALVELHTPEVATLPMVEGPGVQFSVTYGYGVGTKRPAAMATWATDA